MLRLLSAALLGWCLLAAGSVVVVAQSKPPGGPPSGPPPGAPGQGPPGPGSNGPGSSGPGSNGQGSNGQGSGNPAGNNATSGGKGNSGPAHSALQFGPVGRWWDDKSVVQAVGIGKAQQRQMDDTFNANKPAILSSYKNFLSEQAKLDALNKDPKVDKAALFAAIDAVSQARASLQKATSEMLLQIRKEMSSAQIEKLEKLQ